MGPDCPATEAYHSAHSTSKTEAAKHEPARQKSVYSKTVKGWY